MPLNQFDKNTQAEYEYTQTQNITSKHRKREEQNPGQARPGEARAPKPKPKPHLIEDVVRPLPPGVGDDADLLEEVRVALRSRQSTPRVHLQLRELSETARVVVAESFGVSEALQQGVGRDHLCVRARVCVFIGACCMCVYLRVCVCVMSARVHQEEVHTTHPRSDRPSRFTIRGYTNRGHTKGNANHQKDTRCIEKEVQQYELR